MNQCKYYCKYKFGTSNLKYLKDVCNIDLAQCDGNKTDCDKAKNFIKELKTS